MPNRLDVLQKLLELARRGFPTLISREAAAYAASAESIHWLVEHNVIVVDSHEVARPKAERR